MDTWLSFDSLIISYPYLVELYVKRSHWHSLWPRRRNRLNSASWRPPRRNRLQPHCGDARNCCMPVYAYTFRILNRTLRTRWDFFLQMYLVHTFACFKRMRYFRFDYLIIACFITSVRRFAALISCLRRIFNQTFVHAQLIGFYDHGLIYSYM